MNIIVNSYVIHQIDKIQHDTETTLKLSTSAATISSESSTDSESNTELFIQQIHDCFKDDYSTKHTKFNQDSTGLFQNQLDVFLTDDSSQNFYEFSKKTLRDLEARMKTESLATGGFFLYIDYAIDNKRYICVVLLNKVNGFDVEIIDGTMYLKLSRNLDIKKLRFGTKIYINGYQAQLNSTRQYISIITSTNKSTNEASKYLKEWINIQPHTSDSDNTKLFVKIIKAIPLPSEYDDRKDFMVEVFNFLNSTKNRTVNLQNLSIHFYEEQDTIYEYITNETHIVLDNEFVFRPQDLKKLVEIKVKTKGINLTIDNNLINLTNLDLANGTVTIRDKGLTQKIDKEIRSLFNDANEL